MSIQPAVAVEQLTKIYRRGRANEVRAVNGISFEVRRGEIFGLLGPNGAGKTTLVNVLTTMTLPTSGRAFVMGHDVVKQALEVRRSIAVVLQQFAVEQFLTVRDNLITFGRLHGYPLEECRSRAEKTLVRFHLAEHVSQKAQELSIGTKRRVQVAKMFMVDSPVLFLDEPAIGMDPFIKRELLGNIQEQARSGRTIFLTTQVLSEAEELCDHIVIVDGGRIRAEGDVASLKQLSHGFYNVTLSFASLPDELLATLRRASPTRMDVKGNTIRLALRTSEADVLAWLAALAKRWPTMNVEISGASLEDVFFQLLDPPGATVDTSAGTVAD